MNNMPVWTLAMTLMAVTGCQNTAQSATPVSMTPVSGTSTVVEVSHSGLVANSNNAANQTIRPPNATYSTFTQPSLTTSHSNQVAVPTTVAPIAISYDASENALQLARRNPNLSILVEAIDAAGLTGALRFAGNNYTIFAPDNAAFEAWFNETTMTKQKLMQNKPLLRILLAYHVVKTQQPLTVAQMQPSQLTTFNNHRLTITNQKTIRDGIGRTAVIKAADIPTRNGTVHVIDKVLFPDG